MILYLLFKSTLHFVKKHIIKSQNLKKGELYDWFC